MTSCRYFNKGGRHLIPQIWVMLAGKGNPDKIIVFCRKNGRYNIPTTENQQVGSDVLVRIISFVSGIIKSSITVCSTVTR